MISNMSQYATRLHFVLQSYDDIIAEVPVRVYIPVNMNEDSAMIVYFHGGGFAFGSIGK